MCVLCVHEDGLLAEACYLAEYSMLYLETEEEQAELAQYLLDNLERRPSVGEIDAKVEEILNSQH